MSYSYDPAVANGVGHLGKVSNSNAATNYLSFDALGRVTASNQVNGSQTYTFGYGYNFASDLTSETYPSGRVVSFSYDNANRVNGASGQMGSQASAYASNFIYAAFGQPTNYQYGNGLGRVMSYNSRLQMQSFTDESDNNSSTPLLNGALGWGAAGSNNGNLLAATYTNTGSGYSSPLIFADTFTYDNVNRLTSATDSSAGVTKWSQGYGFNQYGNMWVSSYAGITPPGNTPRSNVYNGSNRIVGGSYDAAGNQTLVNGNTLTYDAEGREITNVSNGTETYAYDGNGKRVQKANSSSTTTFVYDALGQLATEVSSAATVPACVTCYLSGDHLGSTRLTTDGSGNVIARHDYLPFGYEIQASDNVGRGSQFGAYDNVNQKFTGKERDAESGLDYFGARYFGSALGRFTSPDWSTKPEPVPYADLNNPQSLNQYAYLRNNPMGKADPDGHCDPTGISCVIDFVESPAGQEAGEWITSNANQLLAGASAILGGAIAGLGSAREPGGYVPGGLTDANGNSVFASKTTQQTAAAPERTANGNLRRDENGKAVPDPEAEGQSHTQLGTRDSKSQPGQRYKQAREFDENGKPVKDVDFTDHGRKDHIDPHEHPYDPTTGKRGPQQVLNKCGSNQTCP